MYAAQGVILRTSIVLGMVAAVVTVLYFTPLPDQYFANCDRPCHDLDWPMICRVKLTLESHQSIGSECDFHNCSSAEKLSRGVLVANRQLPGPAIQVCQNDILVVDVVNKIPGHSITIHWRGQPQNEAPTMDGVPMVTQCPISSYTTFQYRFRASSPGTHLWHAHSGSEISDGIFGALIVRQPRKMEPQRKLYDIDDRSQIMVISEWNNEASEETARENQQQQKSLMINGKEPSDPLMFRVKKGKRYRFRVAYTGGCPITFSVDQHFLKVIAVDGNPINPYEVGSISLSKGERVDFVLRANRNQDRYALKVASECRKVAEGRGFVAYDGLSDEEQDGALMENKGAGDVMASLKSRKFETSFCESNLGLVCISDVHSLVKPEGRLIEEEVDRKIYLGFDFKIHKDSIDAKKGFESKIYRMNNITFTYPSSPLLTQREDVPEVNICNSLNKPVQCRNVDVCECVHIEQISLGASVELLLVDQGGDSEETVFHLHGNQFYVIGYRNLNRAVSMNEVKILDEGGQLVKRNFVSPVLKDTIRVPKFGAVALRFTANNPGYWILRDEHSKQWSRGMDVILQVGDSCDMPSKPSNFPTCGSWIGPEFFLS